ncbi:hypothetical protein JKP88DRAFT_264019 [Tribonema minus]|uniref:EF-hand domain-containing protein n=1 Tax=Tribonema minus TaxID=303371 RepID=A0A835Z0R6_9STRA|nr:hypothetical protein JKP88DRAFT_264019 [Tribonema minus]
MTLQPLLVMPQKIRRQTSRQDCCSSAMLNITAHQQHPWAQQQRGGDRFEIGQLFERFDSDKDGRLTRAEFEKLMNLRVQQQRQQAPDPDQYSAATAPTRLPGSPSPPRPPHHQRQRHMAADAPNMRWSQPAPAASAAAPSYGYPILPGALPLTHYNETAGVPLRKDAVEEQVALGHTVVPLHEAYSRRLARLQALVTSKLLPAREQLLQLRRRLLARGEEVQSAKAAIERETMADAHTILERLRSAEALKMATLEQRMSDVATELEQLDRLAQQVAGAAGTQEQGGGMAGAERYTHEFESTAKMIELVQSYGDLCASVERAASRLQDTSIAVTPNDFPQETAERLEVLRRADRYEKALAIKDQMIWNLMQEASHVVEKATAEAVLSKEYANEMAEWVDLTNRLTAQISELRLENARVPALEQENAKLEEQNRMLRARLAATGVGPDRNQ